HVANRAARKRVWRSLLSSRRVSSASLPRSRNRPRLANLLGWALFNTRYRGLTDRNKPGNLFREFSSIDHKMSFFRVRTRSEGSDYICTVLETISRFSEDGFRKDRTLT